MMVGIWRVGRGCWVAVVLMVGCLGCRRQVQAPLTETFFAKSFGMVADKFGVGWMIIAGPKNP